MVTFETLKNLALALPETTEAPHFEKTSFRVNKKIFATYDAAKHQSVLKFSAINQDVFCAAGQGAIFAVPNKWGKQGWTVVDLATVNPDLFADALTTAYCEVAPKKLTELVRPNE